MWLMAVRHKCIPFRINAHSIHKTERYTSENQEHDNVWSKTMKKMFLFRQISLLLLFSNMKQALPGKHAKLNTKYIFLALDEQTYAILYAYVHILIYQLCLKIDIIEHVYVAYMHMV